MQLETRKDWVFRGMATRRMIMSLQPDAEESEFGLFLRGFQTISSGLPGAQAELAHAFAALLEDQPVEVVGQVAKGKLRFGAGQTYGPDGTRLTVEDTPDGVLLRAMPVFQQSAIDAVFGSMKYAGPSLSLEDMDAAIASEAKRRARD